MRTPPRGCRSVPPVGGAERGGQSSQGGQAVGQAGQTGLHDGLLSQSGSAPFITGAEGSGQGSEGGQAVGQADEASLQLSSFYNEAWQVSATWSQRPRRQPGRQA